MSRTPARSTSAAENQATIDDYYEGWRELNRAMRRGEPWSGGERNAAFLGNGRAGERFDMVDVAPLVGLDDDADGRSAARIDIDFDGDDDLVVTNRTSPRVRILANRWADGTPGVAVNLVGAGGNREAAGAVVFATPVESRAEPGTFLRIPGVTQRRTRTIGSGYLAQSSAWLRFALPPRGEEQMRAPRVHLAVRWPDAGLQLEDFGVVRAGKRYILRQGTGSAEERSAPAALALEATPLAEFGDASTSGRRRLVLPAPASIASLAVRSRRGESARLFGITPDGPRGAGKPAVVIAWDSRDPDAIERLGGLRTLATEVRAAGAIAVAIDLAERGDPAAPDPLLLGATRLQAAGFEGDVLGAVGETPSILGQLVAWRLDRPEPPALPWSFVIGADGRLDVVRTGPWSEGEARRDLAFCMLVGDQRTAVATPLGGIWLDAPTEANIASLQRRLERVGASGAVRELDLARVSTVAPEAAGVQIRLGQTFLEQREFAKALERFDAATAAEPENALAHRARAYTLHLMERYAEALEAWTRAVDLQPEDVQTRVNRGLAAIAAGKLATARADLEALGAAGKAGSDEALALKRALVLAESKGGGAPR